MGALLLVGIILLVVGIAAVSVIATLASLVFGTVIWLVLLPFRIIFWGLKLAFVAVAGVVGLGLFLAVAIIGGVALLLALVAPLLPILLVVGLIWILVRSTRRVARA